MPEANGEVQSGLEGVVAFATQIAEPDKQGSALRYRGVDIEELVGTVPFEKVWGLLVDGEFEPGLPPAEPWPLTVRSGDARVDVQSALAMLAPEWGFRPLIDITDEECRENLARASVMALSFVAQSARGSGRPPVPQTAVDKATSIPERFLIRWRAEGAGRRGARGGGARRAAGAQARPSPRHQRRVLVGGGARLRGDPPGSVHAAVHVRAGGRLERAHPRAEARGAPDPPDGEVHRSAGAAAGRGAGGGVAL